MYKSLHAYDRDKAMAEDAQTTAAQAQDRIMDPAVKKCPPAAALLPSLKANRSALITEAEKIPPNADMIISKREPLVAFIRFIDDAKANCQGKESPYAVAERQQAEAKMNVMSGSVSAEAGPSSSKAQITAWQQFLASKGCNPGPVDGAWGSMTAAATQRYKQGTCTGADGAPKPGGTVGYKPPPAQPVVAPPSPSPSPVPPVDSGRSSRAEIISGVPNSALAVGGLAIVALGIAVVVKKRRRGGGPDSIPKTRYQEPVEFAPVTLPMSRSTKSSRRPAPSTRRSSPSTRRAGSSGAKTKRSR